MPVPAKPDDAPSVASLVHLYRGEVARGDSWRARLDNTTNWALTTAAAVVSFGLGSANASHAVFLAGIYLVLNFLLIEAGRYRKWDVYLRRVRLLETGLFVPLLRDEPPDPLSLRELGQMLEAPRLEVRFWVALAQRIRRAYGAVLGVLLIAWLVKLTVHHEELRSAADFVARAHVGFVPGGAVLSLVAALYLFLGFVTALSFWTRPPATELRPRRRRRSLREAFEGAATQLSRPLSP
ncbi:MAG TPA: DUF2270 domain-containing protein [Myxococcales bacterium]